MAWGQRVGYISVITCGILGIILATPWSFSVLEVEGYLKLDQVAYGEKLHGSKIDKVSGAHVCFVHPTLPVPQ